MFSLVSPLRFLPLPCRALPLSPHLETAKPPNPSRLKTTWRDSARSDAMGAAGAAAAAPRQNPSPSPHRQRRAASALSPAKSNGTANANAAADARPKQRSKAVSSRYLLGPSSKSASTSTSTSTSTTTTSSSSNSTSTSASTPSRRFASPLPRRSVSVDRPRPASNVAAGEAAGSNVGTTTTTRSISVAFQGRSFSFEASKAKPAASPSPVRRPVASAAGVTTPERRRPGVGAVPERGRGFEGGQSHHRWPMSARVSQGFEGNPLAKSYDCSLHKRDAAVLAAVRSLRQSMVFEEGVRRSSFDGGDYLMSSDTESVSSGSNSGSQDAGIGISHRAHPLSKGRVPASFLQDAAASRSHRFADPGTPYLTHSSGLTTSPRTAPVKKSQSLLSGFISSPLNRSMRQPSPSKLTGNSSRRMSSPSRPRNSTGSSTSSWDQHRRVSSGYGLYSEVKRRWLGGSKVDCEHLLRILSNRYLQWRCVNAQADAALAAQKLTAEKYLCDAWITTLGMRKSVALKRFQLQLYRNNWNLMTVLTGQMAYLEEWSLLERDYAESLSGIVEALTTTILCLPVTDGAKADIQDVKNAVGSAVDIMQTIGSSICALLSKLAGTSVLVSDLAKVATEERSLMDQSRELLSTLATMHVKYCSLQGQKVQTTRRRPMHP